MNWRILAEFAGFQFVWLACALGASHGSNAPGLAAAIAFLAVQLMRHRSTAVLVTVLASGATGSLVESLLATAAMVHYNAAWPTSQLAPAWMIALWLAYGSTIATTAQILKPRAIAKAAILGAIFGPLAYLAGERLGALSISRPPVLGCIAIAFAWSLVLPGLIKLHRHLESRAGPSSSDKTTI